MAKNRGREKSWPFSSGSFIVDWDGGMMTSIQATKNAMSADSAIAAKQKLTRRSPTRKGRSEIQLKDI
jgi:hypothetical protein